ncbi:hypothetical protein TcWFU_000099 [Taenia crassiceps]|uniref:Uncharacterized protein n=1 Tax=Taenia crassiceps TaxID=6207 RepID=A0ABR4Q8Q5_9CEST
MLNSPVRMNSLKSLNKSASDSVELTKLVSRRWNVEFNSRSRVGLTSNGPCDQSVQPIGPAAEDKTELGYCFGPSSSSPDEPLYHVDDWELNFDFPNNHGLHDVYAAPTSAFLDANNAPND